MIDSRIIGVDVGIKLPWVYELAMQCDVCLFLHSKTHPLFSTVYKHTLVFKLGHLPFFSIITSLSMQWFFIYLSPLLLILAFNKLLQEWLYVYRCRRLVVDTFLICCVKTGYYLSRTICSNICVPGNPRCGGCQALCNEIFLSRIFCCKPTVLLVLQKKCM